MKSPRSKLTKEEAQAIFDLAAAWVEATLLAERAFFTETKTVLAMDADGKRNDLRARLVQLAEGRS